MGSAAMLRKPRLKLLALEQGPFAVLDRDQYAPAAVETGMGGRRHVVDALGCDELLRPLERVAERRPELGRSGFGLLERCGNCLLQEEPGIVDVRAERRRLRPIQLFVAGDVVRGDSLRWHAVGDLG